MEKVGNVFQSALDDRHIHIVVRAPPDGAYRNIPQRSDCALTSGPVQIGPAAPKLLTISCWVFLDDPDRVFPVKIAPEESVGALKDEIKKKKSPIFDDMPADRLDLWKVSERIAHSPVLIRFAGVHSP